MPRGKDLLPRRNWSEAEIATVGAMIQDGHSQREVAQALGRSEAAVRVLASRRGFASCPEAVKAHQREGIRAANQRPEVKASRAAASSKRWANPEARDRAAAIAKALNNIRYAQAARGTPEAIAAHAAANRARGERKLAWCPAERRDEYRRLCRGMPAAEARAVILADVAAKAERAKRAAEAYARTFEGQLARAKAGARVEERFVQRPANDYHLTLGGVASYGA